MLYVVTSSGINKKGEPYSRLVPIIELPNGTKFLDDKQGVYVQTQHPILQKFKNSFEEVGK